MTKFNLLNLNIPDLNCGLNPGVGPNFLVSIMVLITIKTWNRKK